MQSFVTLHYESEHCNWQVHSSLTHIYLYIHRMNFDKLCVTFSYPQLDASCGAKYRSLNCLLIWYTADLSSVHTLLQYVCVTDSLGRTCGKLTLFFLLCLRIGMRALQRTYRAYAYSVTIFSASFPFGIAWRNLTSAQPSEYYQSVSATTQCYALHLKLKVKIN